MSQPRRSTTSTGGRQGALPAAGQLDADLQRTVRRTAYMRQGFYVVVLLVALAGQVSGAVETLHIPLIWAIPAVGALELGGIVVLANADVRRRLGERAVASRILSVAIAAGAVAFNWLAHADHLLGGFFAGMSALGYLVWLMHTENQRRDRLRATGDLAWTTPAYEVVGHWLAHPWLTRRARAMAKADPELGLYDSLAAARTAVRRERRESAIAKVLHRKIRAAVDPTTADIAVHVYDLEEIATRLADGADYAGLTALIAADLAPARLAAAPTGRRRGRHATVDSAASAPALPYQPGTAGPAELPAAPVAGGVNGHSPQPATGPLADVTAPLIIDPTLRPALPARAPMAGGPPRPAEQPVADRGQPVVDDDESVDPLWGPAGAPARPGTGRRTPASRQQPPVLTPALRQVVGEVLPPKPRTAPAASATPRPAAVVSGPLASEAAAANGSGMASGHPAPNALPSREASLRSLVHATLDERVPAGDPRDTMVLVDMVTDALQLSELERLSATSYVHTWQTDMDSGRRINAS